VELRKAVRSASDTTWENHFGKRRQVRDQHNELRLVLREKPGGRNFDVIFRAFNDGVAFRYVLPAQDGMKTFISPESKPSLLFPPTTAVLPGQHDPGKGFHGPQEWEFKPQPLADIRPESILGLPLLVQTPRRVGGVDRVGFARLVRDVDRTVGKRRQRRGRGCYPGGQTCPRLDGQGLVKAAAPHASPWRVLIIGREPGRVDREPDGPQPGRALPTRRHLVDQTGPDGVGPFGGPGRRADGYATLKQYIQLAADMGWPYQLVDWWWYGEPNTPASDLRKSIRPVNLQEAPSFAAEKNVRLWLWVRYNDLERFETVRRNVFARFQSWGIAGVKIDFMDSDDQTWSTGMSASPARRPSTA